MAVLKTGRKAVSRNREYPPYENTPDPGNGYFLGNLQHNIVQDVKTN